MEAGIPTSGHWYPPGPPPVVSVVGWTIGFAGSARAPLPGNRAGNQGWPSIVGYWGGDNEMWRAVMAGAAAFASVVG